MQTEACFVAWLGLKGLTTDQLSALQQTPTAHVNDQRLPAPHC